MILAVLNGVAGELKLTPKSNLSTISRWLCIKQTQKQLFIQEYSLKQPFYAFIPKNPTQSSPFSLVRNAISKFTGMTLIIDVKNLRWGFYFATMGGGLLLRKKISSALS